MNATEPKARIPMASWVAVLQVAEKWGIPPWEVSDAPLIWFLRQIEFDDAVNKGLDNR